MKKDIIKEQVVKILALQLSFEPHEIKPESDLKADLYADEQDEIEIVVLLEEEFNVEIDDKIAVEWETVKDILDTLDREL